jgi:hypothetical protein
MEHAQWDQQRSKEWWSILSCDGHRTQDSIDNQDGDGRWADVQVTLRTATRKMVPRHHYGSDTNKQQIYTSNALLSPATLPISPSFRGEHPIRLSSEGGGQLFGRARASSVVDAHQRVPGKARWIYTTIIGTRGSQDVDVVTALCQRPRGWWWSDSFWRSANPTGPGFEARVSIQFQCQTWVVRAR